MKCPIRVCNTYTYHGNGSGEIAYTEQEFMECDPNCALRVVMRECGTDYFFCALSAPAESHDVFIQSKVKRNDNGKD